MKKILIILILTLFTFIINAQTIVETVSSGTSGDATLVVESDTDNNNEDDNPKIVLKQDGNLVIGEIGLNGSAAQYTGALVNSMFIGTTTSVDASLQLITRDIARMTLHSEGNVGIGTATPTSLLEIANTSALNGDNIGFNFTLKGAKSSIKSTLMHATNNVSNLSFFTDPDGGSAIERMRITEGGNIGIGTTSPTAKLEVKRLGSTLGGKWIPANSYLTLDSGNGSTLLLDPNEIYGSSALYFGSKSGDIAVFRTVTETSSSDKMIIKNNGNVGIGTKTPDAKLAVNGNIHTKEVKVDLTGWSDFVFKSTYNLPTLKEVEQHIKENGHLKDIPSAEDVKKDGFFLGEMDSKLLQKIEELTLYTIQQEKKIQSLSSRLIEIEKLFNNKY